MPRHCRRDAYTTRRSNSWTAAYLVDTPRALMFALDHSRCAPNVRVHTCDHLSAESQHEDAAALFSDAMGLSSSARRSSSAPRIFPAEWSSIRFLPASRVTSPIFALR